MLFNHNNIECEVSDYSPLQIYTLTIKLKVLLVFHQKKTYKAPALNLATEL